jgi:glucosamine--fructose-6-phosphate aminotransferase (isomerizing)
VCGIIGYTGRRAAAPLLWEGLRRLEYRGYDGAGLATVSDRGLHVRKCGGGLSRLAQLVTQQPAPGCLGIGHTRWATHGGATDTNTHPHVGGTDLVAVAHNGIIENYASLKARLQQEGCVFRSDTDSEVVAQLIARHYHGDLGAAVRTALPLLKGTYALAIVSPQSPGQLVGARLGSPLVLGLGAGESFLASDSAAFAEHAQQVVYLQDHEACCLTADEWQVLDRGHTPVRASVHRLEWDAQDADKGCFQHHMLKEIYEQPEALEKALSGRIDDANASVSSGELGLSPERLLEIDRVILTACGTSYHAALIGEYLLEELAHLPAEVEYASEFRYRRPPLGPKTLVVAVSQSGETADTLAALRECKRRHCPTLAVCNAVGSTMARTADGVVFLQAGPEIGVASTKAFTSQVTVLALLALLFGRSRHLSRRQGERVIRALGSLPDAVRQVLACHDQVQEIAAHYAEASIILYLGRLCLYPLALEGALKLKEIGNMHAEGYPAAEMKHGPIALVDKNTPSVFLISDGAVFGKVMSNLEEVKARGSPIIAVAATSDERTAALVRSRADHVIRVPRLPDYLQAVVSAVPLQLLAYHIALVRGGDVDRPRNLAKSVTVE